jgi:acetyl esterase/lipase
VLRAIGDIALHLPSARRDPLGALDLLSSGRGARATADLAYGPDAAQRADLYLPASQAGSGGAVLFLHGGRWSYGCKEQYRFVARSLAARGHAAIICDYRKYPQVRFPRFVEDAAAAIAWARALLPRHGIDPSGLFVMGHSAGAQLAALATMDRSYAEATGIDPDSIAGLVLMAGPFDFFPKREPDLREMFSPEDGLRRSQAIRFAREGLPPALFLHGRRDRTVRPSSSVRMASAIRELGGSARVILYDYLGHTDILATLSDRVGFLIAPVLDDIDVFLRHRLEAIAGAPRVQLPTTQMGA